MKFQLTALSLIAILCSSCEHQNEPQNQQIVMWDGTPSLIGSQDLPACIIWFDSLHGRWSQYKGFSQGVEIRHIVDLLLDPEIKSKERRINTRANNKLSLVYYNGWSDYNWQTKIVDVYFDIKDGAFAGPSGQSKILANILLDKPESGLYLYRMLGDAYSSKDMVNLRRSVAKVRTLREKWEKGQEVNDPELIYAVTHTLPQADRMEKLIDQVQRSQKDFRKRYGIPDSNSKPQN